MRNYNYLNLSTDRKLDLFKHFPMYGVPCRGLKFSFGTAPNGTDRIDPNVLLYTMWTLYSWRDLVYRAITEYHCSLHATHIMNYELLLLLLVVVLCFRCPREPQPLWCDHNATPRTHMAYTQDQAHNDCKSLYVKAKQIALCNVNSVTWMSVSTHNPCKASTSSIIVTSLWLQNKVETLLEFAIVLFVSLQTKLSSERMIKTIPSTLIV